MKLPIALFLAANALHAGGFEDSYKLEDIPLPAGLPPEVGGLAFDADGYLYVSLRRSDVFRAKPTTDPQGFSWSLFASGFHNGCGIVAPEPGKILVAQMAELTSATDTDGDGLADRYRNVADGWGLFGNYHETNDIATDGKGGYFLAIGTASHNGPVFEHTKGEFSAFGRRGRNFSSVKYRGWILHLDSDGKLTPWASGFRMHNGIYTDPDGETWCGDNQGDWKAITPFYHIEKGNFYGHPSSLVWDENWPAEKDPLLTYRNDLDAYNKHRTEAAVLLPHGFCRSAAQPIMIPKDGIFGEAYAGQYILPDNNGTRLCRVSVEKVAGKYQGMATYLLNGGGLRSGNNRLTFSPDGKTLYIGQTVRGWGALAEGLQRLIHTGGTPFDVKNVTITPDGFRLEFTSPPGTAPAAKDIWIGSAIYQPKWTYGSDAEDERNHKVIKVTKSGDLTFDLASKIFQRVATTTSSSRNTRTPLAHHFTTVSFTTRLTTFPSEKKSDLMPHPGVLPHLPVPLWQELFQTGDSNFVSFVPEPSSLEKGQIIESINGRVHAGYSFRICAKAKIIESARPAPCIVRQA